MLAGHDNRVSCLGVTEVTVFSIALERCSWLALGLTYCVISGWHGSGYGVLGLVLEDLELNGDENVLEIFSTSVNTEHKTIKVGIKSREWGSFSRKMLAQEMWAGAEVATGLKDQKRKWTFDVPLPSRCHFLSGGILILVIILVHDALILESS